MTRRNLGPRRWLSKARAAFTLIELMVVIAIIAILVALTAAGIQQVRISAQQTVCISEIAQLGSAIESFKQDRRVQYLPRVIVLREKMDYDLNSPADVASASFLKQVWP